ncbi:MAG: hypothetical protein ACT4NT_07895 [Nitrososphaerota archaeon]
MARELVLCASVLSLFVILTGSTQAHAVDETSIKATDQIKNSPALMHMLKKIEMSKKILAEMQEQKNQQDKNAQKMQEIRKTVQAKLDEKLNRMNQDNEPFTAQSAFSRFIAKKPSELQNVYWSMFNYQQEKVKSAKDSRDAILSGGGKSQDAWNAYHKNAAISRTKIIELNKDYNIRYANANADIQNIFDVKGKLPRTD